MLLVLMLLLLLHFAIIDAARSPEQRGYSVEAIWHPAQHVLLLTCCLVCYSFVQSVQPVRNTAAADSRQINSMSFLLHSTAACITQN